MEPLEQRMKRLLEESSSKESYRGNYGDMVEVLYKNTNRSLTPFELTKLLKKKEKLYLNLKRGEQTPIAEIEDAFGERAEYDENLIKLEMKNYFSKWANLDYEEMHHSRKTLKKLKKKVSDYYGVLQLYHSEDYLCGYTSKDWIEGLGELLTELDNELKDKTIMGRYNARAMSIVFGVGTGVSTLSTKIGMLSHISDSKLFQTLFCGTACGIISYIVNNQTLKESGREQSSIPYGILLTLLGIAGSFTGIYYLSDLINF